MSNFSTFWHMEKNIELKNFFLPSQQNFSSPYKNFFKQKAVTNSFVGSTNRFVDTTIFFLRTKK